MDSISNGASGASRRPVAVLLALLATIVVGSSVLATPASAAYRPQVKLSAYHVHRGHYDAALLRHFAPSHYGTVTTRNHRHTVRLKRFRTDRAGDALFSFRIPKSLSLGIHVLVFRTGTKWASVRIKVLR